MIKHVLRTGKQPEQIKGHVVKGDIYQTIRRTLEKKVARIAGGE